MELDTDWHDAPKKAKAVVAKAVAGGSKAVADAPKGKAIEDIYQKKTQLEHILLRPDTYIGSTEKQQQPLWVHDGERMQQRNVTFVPGLYKIFDEILVNAADNKVRDPTMDMVKVTIDPAANLISVWNNGDGVPVEMHKEERVYVPELIFGHLLTSSNYNDDEKKVTGGRNGYGAKLANIFSTEFTIETCDGKRSLSYKQTFRNNMSVKGEPVIKACKPSDNWTKVSFRPDLAKFGMQELEEDVVALMRKRVYDLAGILAGKGGAKVYLNGTKLDFKSFQDYVDLYLGPKATGPPRVYERINDRWEICISATDGQFNQVSFVNSICTTKGGTHVNMLVDQITKAMVERINKRNKNANVKPFMVKNHLWVFVNTQIENPAFDSQTKESLTLRASSFGSKCELPAAFLDKLAKCGLVDSILSFAEFKNQKTLQRSDGAKRSRLTGITKLDDANDAGGRNSTGCTLILTEGDSAKALAISGLGVVGRNAYGVFPLRGKLLNVRDANATQVSANAEIQAIKQILGLQHGKNYEDARSLRYGHLMIMTDQDHDGSHIKGLIMNFLHAFFPSLLKIPGFLLEFITPIVKVRKGRQTLAFYTLPEYEVWKERQGNNARGWETKYYKGLGTSTKEEAREYFSALDAHRKEFVWEGDDDSTAIEMAFSKKKIEERKAWLSSFEPGTFLDNSATHITYSDFINKELILFSRADLERSIPSMVDGLKPGQRKILFAAFKRNLKKDIKVAQLAAYVSEHSAYHHGETSLATTIVNLAQDFVGSNNINLLHPSGQFGTRLQGGKDAASARYIYTRLAPLTRHLFHEADDALLDYLNEEGQSIEPSWYMPLLPMVLVNGAEGIGTGWSTSIPNYRPHDIVANLKRLMAGEEQQPMHPWYRGFKGSITHVENNKSIARSYKCSGTITQLSESKLEITELPVRKWTQDYKEFLEGMVKPENKDETPTLTDYKEHHSDSNVHFELELPAARMTEALAAGLDTKFKLTTKFATSNMMLFNSEGAITHYESPEQIIEEFFALRLHYYELRRLSMLKDAEAARVRLDNRARFILAVVEGSLVVGGRKRATIEADLQTQGFDRLEETKGKGRHAAASTEEEDEESAAAATPAAASGGSYNYLLSMPLHSLTAEKIAALRAEAMEQAAKVEHLRGTDARTMWADDLDAFLQVYDEWEAAEESRSEAATRQQLAAKKGGKGAKGKAAAKSKKKKSAGSDSDEEMEDIISDDDLEDDDFDASSRAAPARKPAAAAAAPKPSAAVPKATAISSAVPIKPAPKVPTAAALAKAAKAAVAAGSSSSSGGSAVASAASSVAAPRAAAAVKAKPAPARKKKAAGSDDEEDDEESGVSSSESEPEDDGGDDDGAGSDFNEEEHSAEFKAVAAARGQAKQHAATRKPTATSGALKKATAAQKAAAAAAEAEEGRSSQAGLSQAPAAASKGAAAAAKAAAVSAKAAASVAPVVAEDDSLEARLAARFKTLNVKPTAATKPSGAAPALSSAATAVAPKPADAPNPITAAATTAQASDLYDYGDEEDGDQYTDMCSPAPAKSRAVAAGSKAGKAAAAKPSAGAAAAGVKQPAKRKPRGKVVSSEDEDAKDSDGSDAEDEDDVYEIDAPSPAIAPKGKKSKVGPSPLHIKAMSKTAGLKQPTAPTATAAPKASTAAPRSTAAASKPSAKAAALAGAGVAGGSSSQQAPTLQPAPATAQASGEDEARGGRARRQVAAKVTYVIEDSSEEEEEAVSGADSDFQEESD